MSSGKAASVSFSALSISSGVPSKKRPHPKADHSQQVKAYVAHLRPEGLTANEERIAGEDSPFISILKEEADAVLRMAWRVQSLHFDVANRKFFVMRWRL